MTIEREAALIAETQTPVTVTSLLSDLKALGLQSGMVVLVHSSLSKLGWVCGGAATVILALREVVGMEGTLVMPAYCGENSNPANWAHPPVPASWVDIIRENMPAFNPSLTPTRGIGNIPEVFRKMDGVVRSNHPQDSFCAYGKHAHSITDGHLLESSMGEGSPLQKIYDLDGWVLLLGVTHANNSSIHLAEYKANFRNKKWIEDGCAMLVSGKRKWVAFSSLDLISDDFAMIGQDYTDHYPHNIHTGKVGQADAILLKQKPLVDFAIDWMQKHRN